MRGAGDVVERRSGGVRAVVEHHWLWYRGNWRASVVSSVLQPLLFLVAFGVGFGALVDHGGRAAPALVAVSAVQSAASESTYPVLSGFKWQRIYHGMAAGPITPGQVAAGHLVWGATKNAFTGAVFVAVVAAVGGVVSPGVLLALAAAVLTGLSVAAPVTALAATVENEGTAFNTLFRFVVLPMTLFSGTFFPIDRLPGWVQPLAVVSPLWHGTELARAAALWRPMSLLVLAGHAGFLVGLVGIGCALAVRQFGRRLAP